MSNVKIVAAAAASNALQSLFMPYFGEVHTLCRIRQAEILLLSCMRRRAQIKANNSYAHDPIQNEEGIQDVAWNLAKEHEVMEVRRLCLADLQHHWYKCKVGNIHGDAHNAEVLQHEEEVVCQPNRHAAHEAARSKEEPWQVCVQEWDKQQRWVEEVACKEENAQAWVWNVNESTPLIDQAKSSFFRELLGNAEVSQETAWRRHQHLAARSPWSKIAEGPVLLHFRIGWIVILKAGVHLLNLDLHPECSEAPPQPYQAQHYLARANVRLECICEEDGLNDNKRQHLEIEVFIQSQRHFLA